MFKLTKEHEGKEVWCVPTGNNISTYGDNKGKGALAQVTIMTVSEVKRKYLRLGYSRNVYLSPNSKDIPHYVTGCNDGYLVFESEDSFNTYKDIQHNISLIKSTLQRSYGDLPLTDSQIERIANIIREG